MSGSGFHLMGAKNRARNLLSSLATRYWTITLENGQNPVAFIKQVVFLKTSVCELA
jgi:hypothetical protein